MNQDIPDGAACRDVPKDADSRVDRRPRAEDWAIVLRASGEIAWRE